MSANKFVADALRDLARAQRAQSDAQRDQSEALDRLAAALSASTEGGSDGDWIDQLASPLGKRAHLRAVRAGLLPAQKVGKRVLVRRTDLDAFVLANAVRAPQRPANDVPDSDLDELMARRARRATGERT